MIPPSGDLVPTREPRLGEPHGGPEILTAGSAPFEVDPIYRVPSDAAHFWDYWRSLRRRRWTVMTVFLATVMVATVWTFTTRPTYVATVTLKIDREEPRVLKFEEVVRPDSQWDY